MFDLKAIKTPGVQLTVKQDTLETPKIESMPLKEVPIPTSNENSDMTKQYRDNMVKMKQTETITAEEVEAEESRNSTTLFQKTPKPTKFD